VEDVAEDPGAQRVEPVTRRFDPRGRGAMQAKCMRIILPAAGVEDSMAV